MHCGEVRHPLTFGGIRAIFVILVHGAFSPMVVFCTSIAKRAGCSDYSDTISEIEASAAPNWKNGRTATGRGREQPSLARPRLLLYPTFPATMDRLRLLGLLGDTWRRPRDPRSAALEVCRLIDRFRSKPREFLGILIVAVLARLPRTANSRAARSRRRAAWSSRSVIGLTMIDLLNLLRDG
jgi:hypothetical protein